MRRTTLIAIALGLLIASGCSSQEMVAFQQECAKGNQAACLELQTPAPTVGLPRAATI